MKEIEIPQLRASFSSCISTSADQFESKAFQVFSLWNHGYDGMVRSLRVSCNAPQNPPSIVGGREERVLEQGSIHVVRAAKRGQRATGF